MEDSEYKTIEQQALQVVKTLNKLKKEIEEYQDAKVGAQKNLDSLDALLGAVTDVAEQLSGAAKDLRESNYLKLHKKMTKKTEALTSACETLQQNLEDVPSKVEAMLESQQAKHDKAQSTFATQIGKAIESDSLSRKTMQETIEAACKGVIDQFNQLPTILTASLEIRDAKQDEKDNELLQRVSNLEEMIARIDRNTQKGFGKERG